MKKKRQHKTELRKFETVRSFCVQPGCKFNGEIAAQGVCYSKLPTATDRYVSSVMKQGQHCLDEMKKLRKVNKQTSDKAWIRNLEGYFVCTWANGVFTLDELVHLRAENAKLRIALGKWSKKP
jgi:hypothetical protein